jgi:hypothetical protein
MDARGRREGRKEFVLCPSLHKNADLGLNGMQ